MEQGLSSGHKRPRLETSQGPAAAAGPPVDLLALFKALPKDLGTASGDPLNLAVLRLLGRQDAAVCCRAALDWCTVGGRRFVLCLNDECRGIGGPFAPIQRLVASHVETLRLGRYGRRTVEERAQIILDCSHATRLRCVYSKLTGLGLQLQEHRPTLSLRILKCHQCRLDAVDVAQLLAHAPRLEAADFFGEALAGLGGQLRSGESGRWPALRSLDITDCGLAAEDAAACMELFGGSLRALQLQACDLRGLRPPRLAGLEVLRLVDCNLARADAAAAMAQCPHLETLVLCGNPFGQDAEENDQVPSWPPMPKLRRADFRACDLEEEDEEELRSCLAAGPALELHVLAAGEPAAAAAQANKAHIVFESSDEEESGHGAEP